MRVAIDAYEFVGLRGGSGGAGSYALALIEHLARDVDVRVIASEGNSRLFTPLKERSKRISICRSSAGHADAIRTATDGADILYAPFTALPERPTYGHIPVVTAIHDLQHRALRSFFPEAERISRDDDYYSAAASAEGIITFSSNERENIIRAYNINRPTTVIPHAPFLAEEIERLGGLDLSPERNPYAEKFGRYILYPAVNWPHKNHYRLIEAFRFVCQIYGVEDVKLVLTGGSCVESREHFYKRLLDQQWAHKRIFDLGFVSHTQLFLLMKGAELLVFPSMYEGFGIPVLEGLRLGTPVLASNLPAMQEWFGHCYHTFTNIRNSLSMARDLYRLIVNPEQRNAYRTEGLTWSKKFSSRRMAKESLEFLSAIVDDSPRLKQQRRSPHRNISQLRDATYRLLLHVVVEKVSQTMVQRATTALSVFRNRLGSDMVGLVVYVPLSESEPDPERRGRRGNWHRATIRSCSHSNSIDAILSGTVQLLPNEGYDVTYYEQNTLLETIQFYASTQTDARYHCLMKESQLPALAADKQFQHRCADALLRDSPKADGFYVGPSSWSILRERAIQVLHNEPWVFAEAEQADWHAASHEFIFTDVFVRRGQVDYFSNRLPLQLAGNDRIMSPATRFAYIETELKERVGHHFTLVNGLCNVAKAGGLVPIVGANRDLGSAPIADINVVPSFSSYSQAPEGHVTPTQFAGELLSFLHEYNIATSDYVYLHMPIPTLIVGVLQVVATSRLDELPVFLIRICSSDESFRWHDVRQTSCIRAIAALGPARRDRVRIFVESVPLQRYFEEATAVTFPVLLNPIARELAVARFNAEKRRQHRNKGDFITIGYLGEAREEKGFHLLPDIIEQVLVQSGSPKVRFCVQISASPHNDTGSIRSARQQLQQLAVTHKANGSVELLTALEDTRAYYQALSQCDVLLMPYDRLAYRCRGSGVALEGLVIGIPIVVAMGTDMAITFEGPWCIVASDPSATAFARACNVVIDNYTLVAERSEEFFRVSPLALTEAQYLNALLHSSQKLYPPAPVERPVALWIGNNVIRQGCSAVYSAQRGFFERQGYEIYNVYVPFPDLDGSLSSDEELEKHLIANSLGWYNDGYHFGCYSWLLSQSDGDERRTLLEDIAELGGSTSRFLLLNGYNTIPKSLALLVEQRPVALVCVNYVHLLPVVEKLGLLGRSDTRVVLETHDIQAYQHAIRANREVDEADKDLEMAKLSDANAVVSISKSEYSEIREHNPWIDLEFVPPTIKKQPKSWPAGSFKLNSDWLDIWAEHEELQKGFDLRTSISLSAFQNWILLYGRKEYPNCPLGSELVSAAMRPHPSFPVSSGGISVPFIIGAAWQCRSDLHNAWPNAIYADHTDRSALLRWATNTGRKELDLLPEAMLPSGQAPRVEQSTCLLEAFLLSRPLQFLDPGFRRNLWRWLEIAGCVNVIIVGSDHPANVAGIQRFIDQVFREYLEPAGVSLAIVGRAGLMLGAEVARDKCFVVGEVETVEPLYRIAEVVAVPTFVGTGTPIKVLDAFAHGLCLSVPSFVDRCLGLSEFGFPLNHSSSEFGSDILNLLKSTEARQKRARLAQQFAEANLSAEIYDVKWQALAGLNGTRRSDRPSTEELASEVVLTQNPAQARPKRMPSAKRERADAD